MARGLRGGQRVSLDVRPVGRQTDQWADDKDVELSLRPAGGRRPSGTARAGWTAGACAARGDVRLDRLDRDEQVRGDLLVGVAAGEQPEHVALPVGELVELGVGRRRLRAGERVQHEPGQPGQNTASPSATRRIAASGRDRRSSWSRSPGHPPGSARSRPRPRRTDSARNRTCGVPDRSSTARPPPSGMCTSSSTTSGWVRRSPRPPRDTAGLAHDLDRRRWPARRGRRTGTSRGRRRGRRAPAGPRLRALGLRVVGLAHAEPLSRVSRTSVPAPAALRISPARRAASSARRSTRGRRAGHRRPCPGRSPRPGRGRRR